MTTDQMKRATHGEVECYRAGCHCAACVQGMRRYWARSANRLRLARNRGTRMWVDVSVVQAHVDSLVRSGMTLHLIGQASGITAHGSIAQSLRFSRRISARKANAILAVRPIPDPGQRAKVDGTGTARRLQALAALGWGAEEVAHRLGTDNPSWVQRLRRMAAPRVERRTADRIAAVYDDLWSTRGPSASARHFALRSGWVPPLAWDDD
ncbi:MAG: hypothetical protein PSX37_02975, partial [bacterium]|nr:hypothetical protein [bacterium]